MKKLPKQIVNIAFFVTMLGIVAYGIGWGMTRPKVKTEVKPSYPQYNNSNPSNWSGVFVGSEIVKDRL
jgi:hypothetical protein